MSNQSPRIACLCGSTRFKDEFLATQKVLTLGGWIVLSVGFFGHADGEFPTDLQKQMLDELHLRKIDLADMVFVINVDGYIGDSTRNEIQYARRKGVTVMFLEPPL